MFCPKCGTKALDGATFCQKCGAKLIAGDTVQQAAIPTPVRQTQPSTPSGTPKKKKSKKLPIILGAVALAVVVIIVIAMNWNGKIDYEATVRAHRPFVSQGTSLTYGEVLDKYISSPNWEVRKSGEVNYVDISGKAKGTDKDLVVTIKVLQDPNDPDLASISPESVTINAKKSPTQNDAVEFLLAMFSAYDEGYDNLSELLSTGEMGTTGKINLTETYTNEAEGFSFQYPSDWTVMDGQELYDASLDDTAVVSLYAPDGFGSASNVLVNKTQADYTLFDYTKSDFEREFSSIFDEVSVTDLSNVNIDGVPAIELGLSINTDAGPLVVVRYYYIVGDYTYIISGTIRQSAIDSDGLVIDAIMGSYKISTANTSGESGAKSSYPFISYGYQGIEIDYLLESIDNVIFQLGDSQLNDEFKLRYDDLEFYHDNGAITSIVCTDPSLLEADGVPLNKNREGLISIFGQPHKEGNDGGGYFMRYDLPNCSLYFELGEPDSEAWRISISPNEATGPAPGEILYNGEPIAHLLGRKLEELDKVFGAPTGGTPVDGSLFFGGTEYCSYDNIYFTSEQGYIDLISGDASHMTVNGTTLDKDRAGIIALFGEPVLEEDVPGFEDEGIADCHVMQYNLYNMYVISIEMPDVNSKATSVSISRGEVSP